ncbi:MAG: hypothetical protein R3D69_08860 [Xanthobacteraceae bacterium]
MRRLFAETVLITHPFHDPAPTRPMPVAGQFDIERRPPHACHPAAGGECAARTIQRALRLCSLSRHRAKPQHQGGDAGRAGRQRQLAFATRSNARVSPNISMTTTPSAAAVATASAAIRSTISALGACTATSLRGSKAPVRQSPSSTVRRIRSRKILPNPQNETTPLRHPPRKAQHKTARSSIVQPVRGEHLMHGSAQKAALQRIVSIRMAQRGAWPTARRRLLSSRSTSFRKEASLCTCARKTPLLFLIRRQETKPCATALCS